MALTSVLTICHLSFWRLILQQLMTFRSERLCQMKQNQAQPMQKRASSVLLILLSTFLFLFGKICTPNSVKRYLQVTQTIRDSPK